jgi:hypothetical protein
LSEVDKRTPLLVGEAAQELAALIQMTRFMSDTVDRLVADPQRLKLQLDQLEAELQCALQHAGPAGPFRRTN